jgi:hypothetical protein
MNITLNIEAGNPVELHEAITGLAGIMGGTVTPQKSEKSKPSNRATKPSDPKPATELNHSEEAETPSNEDMSGDDTTGVETEAAEIPTVVELRAAAQAKGGTPEGKKAIKALLDKFESKSISDVPEDKRAAFLTALGGLD